MDATVLAALAAGAALGAVVTYAALRGRGAPTAAGPGQLDPLTGVADRRAGEARIAGLRPGDAVVMVDIDHFKVVNDTSGHPHGDTVLRAFASSLAASVRADDMVARWGGDEFLLVLAGAGKASLRITQRLHAAWAAGSPEPAVTCSAGVAVYAGGDPASVVAAADAAMFAAKRAGRDRVSAA